MTLTEPTIRSASTFIDAGDSGPTPGQDRLRVEAILGSTLRSSGTDALTVQFFVENSHLIGNLVVRQTDRQIIDGAHRLEAARRLGFSVISIVWFDGSDDEVFEEFIRCNCNGPRALNRMDRRSAAFALAASRRNWSDRRIAELCGISPKLVGRLRATAPAQVDDTEGKRVGRDGRFRPLRRGSSREQIQAAILEDPSASLRSIAKRIGVSPETVRTVKRQINEPKHPLGDDFVNTALKPSSASSLAAVGDTGVNGVNGASVAPNRTRVEPANQRVAAPPPMAVTSRIRSAALTRGFATEVSTAFAVQRRESLVQEHPVPVFQPTIRLSRGKPRVLPWAVDRALAPNSLRLPGGEVQFAAQQRMVESSGDGSDRCDQHSDCSAQEPDCSAQGTEWSAQENDFPDRVTDCPDRDSNRPPTLSMADWLDGTNPECDIYAQSLEVPLSRVYEIADEARRRAEWWKVFAETVEARVRTRPTGQRY